MQWKLFLLLAWLVLGDGGCRPGGSFQPASRPNAPMGDDGSYVGMHHGLTTAAYGFAPTAQ